MKKSKASITVFTAIVLLVVMATGFIGMDLACAFNAKSIVSSATDMAIDSALSNYDRTLAEYYGLYGVESDNIKSSFEGTINSNLENTDDSANIFRFDNLSYEVTGAYSLAETTVLESQITNARNNFPRRDFITKKNINLFDDIYNLSKDNKTSALNAVIIDSVPNTCKNLQKAETIIETFNGTNDYSDGKTLKEYLLELEDDIIEQPSELKNKKLYMVLSDISSYCSLFQNYYYNYCVSNSLDDMGEVTKTASSYENQFKDCNKYAFLKANEQICEYSEIANNQINEAYSLFDSYEYSLVDSENNGKTDLLLCYENINNNYDKYVANLECIYYGDTTMEEKKGDFSSTYPKNNIKTFSFASSATPSWILDNINMNTDTMIELSRNSIDENIANLDLNTDCYSGANFENYDIKASTMFNNFIDNDDWWIGKNFVYNEDTDLIIGYSTTWSRICDAMQYFPCDATEYSKSQRIDEYIVNMFSSYNSIANNPLNREIPNTTMKNCQVEYIITGIDDSQKALQTVANRIFAMRFYINFYSLLRDVNPYDYINYANWCTYVEMGYTVEYTTYSLFARWAACESYYETQLLLNGNKVPSYKSVDNMHFNCDLTINTTNYSDDKLSYNDYLLSLLAVTGRQEKMKRVSSMIEVGMYDLTGSYIYLYDYYGYLRADVSVDSKYLFLNKMSFTGFERQSKKGASTVNIKRIRGY